MALRSCLISCRDLSGTEHAVEVTAESLYEAVAQALGILRGDQWVEEIGECLTELKVRVKQPAVVAGAGEGHRWSSGGAAEERHVLPSGQLHGDALLAIIVVAPA